MQSILGNKLAYFRDRFAININRCTLNDNINKIKLSTLISWSNLVVVMDWGGANTRFLGLMSVGAAQSLDQTALRPSVIKRIRHIDVKYITHIASHACD